MSLAVVDALLGADEPPAAMFAQSFVAAYQRDPRAGYARGFEQLLDEVSDGADLQRRIRPDSVRNGAAMRSVPLGVIDDIARLRRVAHAQARVTHDTPAGRLSSEVVGLMAHALIHRQAGVAELAAFVETHAGFALRADWSGEVEVDAVQTLHAVHTALVRQRSLTALLIDCVEFGGDVDSVAAIALGLASLAPEFKDDLAPSLHGGLENGAFGRDHLISLDDAMTRRWPALAQAGRRRSPAV